MRCKAVWPIEAFLASDSLETRLFSIIFWPSMVLGVKIELKSSKRIFSWERKGLFWMPASSLPVFLAVILISKVVNRSVMSWS